MTSDQLDPVALAIILVALLVVLIAWVLVAVVAYVVTALCLARFFRKVGVEEWIAWVPVYSGWKFLEVGGLPGVYVLFGLIPYGGIVTIVFTALAMHRIGIAFGKEAAWVVLGIFLPWVWWLLLARAEETYRPEWIAAAGYPPPRAGTGSAPPVAV